MVIRYYDAFISPNISLFSMHMLVSNRDDSFVTYQTLGVQRDLYPICWLTDVVQKTHDLPSGKLTQPWKITICSGLITHKWPCSIAIGVSWRHGRQPDRSSDSARFGAGCMESLPTKMAAIWKWESLVLVLGRHMARQGQEWWSLWEIHVASDHQSNG